MGWTTQVSFATFSDQFCIYHETVQPIWLLFFFSFLWVVWGEGPTFQTTIHHKRTFRSDAFSSPSSASFDLLSLFWRCWTCCGMRCSIQPLALKAALMTGYGPWMVNILCIWNSGIKSCGSLLGAMRVLVSKKPRLTLTAFSTKLLANFTLLGLRSDKPTLISGGTVDTQTRTYFFVEFWTKIWRWKASQKILTVLLVKGKKSP